MTSIGFPISPKENEFRRALTPPLLAGVGDPQSLFFEEGYGTPLGYTDGDYLEAGANVVSRDEALSASVVCDPKIGDADYLGSLSAGQVVFGWLHAVQNPQVVDALLESGLTAYAWEDMFVNGRHVFWRNNELAGEAAIIHAFTLFGELPSGKKVALIGRGNVARGAYRMLSILGADVTVYDRQSAHLIRSEIGAFDAVVNGVLWDPARTDHILYRADLAKMKPRSMIVDVSCDRAGGIETSVPTTIEAPTYEVGGVTHYVVDHTPALLFRQASEEIGAAVLPFLNRLVDGVVDEVLERSLAVEEGRIVDQRINELQGRL